MSLLDTLTQASAVDLKEAVAVTSATVTPTTTPEAWAYQKQSLCADVVRCLLKESSISTSESDRFKQTLIVESEKYPFVIANAASIAEVDPDQLQNSVSTYQRADGESVSHTRVDGAIFKGAVEYWKKDHGEMWQFCKDMGIIPVYQNSALITVLVESKNLRPSVDVLEQIGCKSHVVFSIEATVKSLQILLND